MILMLESDLRKEEQNKIWEKGKILEIISKSLKEERKAHWERKRGLVATKQ